MSPDTGFINGKKMVRITAYRCCGNKRCPLRIFVGYSIETAGFQHCCGWEITSKMTGININPFDYAWQTQLNDSMVMASITATLRLPAIHPFPMIVKLAYQKHR
ncbi:hypothetical protein VI06_14820 [Aquitalea magnusonii]|nr:hypothetical protein VI06_14820 [Aquitalea magnusonii]